MKFHNFRFVKLINILSQAHLKFYSNSFISVEDAERFKYLNIGILLIGHGIFLVRKLAVVYNGYRPRKQWNNQKEMDSYEL